MGIVVNSIPAPIHGGLCTATVPLAKGIKPANLLTATATNAVDRTATPTVSVLRDMPPSAGSVTVTTGTVGSTTVNDAVTV
ncbi:MAG: hypothetical protein GY856_31680 [bacterium]|nr:hypothetical protein [bacterium]